MKKHLITLLVIASMLLYPVAAFAGTEEADVSEDQQTEAVVTEEVSADEAEAEPEATEEAAAEEEAAEVEAVEAEAVEEELAEPEADAAEEAEAVEEAAAEEAAPAEESAEAVKGVAPAEPVKAKKADKATALKTELQDSGEEEPEVKKGWNSDRTIYYDDNGNPTVGLFKASMTDGVGALFYANDKGYVVKTSKLITVYGDKTRYLRSKDSEGHWGFRKVDKSDKNTYTYLIGTSGEGAIAEAPKFYSTSKGKYYVQSNGTVKTDEGIVTVGSKKYYIRSNGKVKVGEGWVRYNGKKYRVESGGVVRTKVGSFKVGSYRYVVKSDGSVATKKGPVKSNNKLYFVKNVKGQLGTYKPYKLKGKIYHVTRNGVIKTGRHTWKDGKLYYSTKKGCLKTKDGMVKQSGERFHVNRGGIVTVNQKFTYNNRSYIATSTGTIKTGLFTWKGTMYFAGNTGALKLKAGIVKVGSFNYYVAAGGVVYVDQRFWSNGSMYIADKEGHLLNGFFTWKGFRHYADAEFKVAANKKFWVDSKLYIASAKGNIHTGFFSWGNTYYIADQQGVVYTKEGVITHSGKRFYNYNGGGLATEKWLQLNGKHYYAGEHAAFYTKGFRYNGVWIKSAEISSDGAVTDEAYQRAMNGGSDTAAEG